MRKYGFKTFSSNIHDNPRIIDDMAKYVFEHRERLFVEFMAVETSTKEDFLFLKDCFTDVEIRIHAPHHLMGFDVGNKSLETNNRKLFEHAQQAADILNAKTIVVHPGCDDGIDVLKETVRQFKLFDDKRIVVENLPWHMCGNTAEEITFIKEYCGCGFCFDFSHALCAANSLGIDAEKQLKGFFELRPDVYHLCDGDVMGLEDKHMHFGEGNYPLKHFIKDYTVEDAYITMETGQGIPVAIEPWVNDFEFMLKIER